MGKLMIRLIDIVFNLLFGFIAISQVGSNLPIVLPKSTEVLEVAPNDAHTILVGVTKAGTYPVEKGELVLKNSYELRSYLTKKLRETELNRAQIGVRICADWDSPVEYGIAVARICRDLGIPKGLDVVRLNSD